MFQTMIAVLNALYTLIQAYADDRANRSYEMNQTLVSQNNSLIAQNATMVAMNSNLAAIASRMNNADCNGCGSELEPPPGQLPGDPQTDPEPTDPNFPTWDDYNDYKCKAANYLADFWERWLFDASVRDWDALSGGVLAVVIAELGGVTVGAILGVVGITLSSGLLLIAGLVIAIAAFIIGGSAVDFADMGTAIQVNRNEIVCAMYNAGSGAIAKADVLQVLTDGGLTSPEIQIMTMLINHYDLNKLFELDSELDNSSFVPSYDCSCQVATGLRLDVAGTPINFTTSQELSTGVVYEIRSSPQGGWYNSMGVGLYPKNIVGNTTARWRIVFESVVWDDAQTHLHGDASSNQQHSFVILFTTCPGNVDYWGYDWLPSPGTLLASSTGGQFRAWPGYYYNVRFRIVEYNPVSACP